MARRRPKWLRFLTPVEPDTVCSWCGVNVPTKEQQAIHVKWHDAVGVVPLEAVSEVPEVNTD